jgi:hypothetical protein
MRNYQLQLKDDDTSTIAPVQDPGIRIDLR